MKKYEFPIKFFYKNLIFNDTTQHCWAVYKLVGFNYEYLSIDAKFALLNRLAIFIANIGVEAKILIVPVSEDVEKHYNRLIGSLYKEDTLYKYAKAHAKGACDYLKEKIKRNGNCNNYKVYVITKIKAGEPENKDIRALYEYYLQRPVKDFLKGFGAEELELLESEIENFEKLQKEYFNSQSKRIALEVADEKDIQWLLRRAYLRGTGEVPLRVSKKKTKVGDENEEDEIPWTPFYDGTMKDGEMVIRIPTKDVLTLSEGEIDTKQNRCLKIDADDTESWQTFLPISFIPDYPFPGEEFLFQLQSYPFPIEVCIHIETLDLRKSVNSVENKRREINAQIDHIFSNGEEVPEGLEDSKRQSELLDEEIKNTNLPLTKMSLTLAIAADNKDTMERNVKFIMEVMKDSKFAIHRPVSDQLKLFMEFLPGTGRYMNDYVLVMPPRTIAGSMFGATSMLGDGEGPYMGYTGNEGVFEKFVYINLGKAVKENESASCGVFGPLGCGKSFNSNLFLYLNIINGGYGLIFDPKGERDKWLQELPELKDQISIITLSSREEDKGKLDPFCVCKDINDAGDLATSMIAELFKIQPKDDEYIALLEAIKSVKKASQPCMNELVIRLQNFDKADDLHPAALRLARRINLIRDMGMAGLLFGTGKEKGLSIENRLNIIQLQNLKMPSPNTKKEDYTQEEVISTVLMLPIAEFAKKYAQSDRSIFKLVLFDESWMLASTDAGLKLYNWLARMGRSLNSACIFVDHSVKGIKGEGIKNAILYKFCFRTEDSEEIPRVLEFLDLEITDENIETLKSLKNGQCLFRDRHGRVGKLQFDAVYKHLLRAFSTTPPDRKGGKDDEEIA